MEHKDPRLNPKRSYSSTQKVTTTVEEFKAAQAKHRVMKRTFKGIYPYWERRILYNIGQKNTHE